MDREIYKDIVGIDKFFECFPNQHWYYFHEVLEFRWYREFDNEEWCDRFCVELTMSDINGKDVILFRFKDVCTKGSCDFSGWISGLEIVNLKHNDISHETHYEVLDFEDSKIHFYCNEIEVNVLIVNGKKVSKS